MVRKNNSKILRRSGSLVFGNLNIFISYNFGQIVMSYHPADVVTTTTVVVLYTGEIFPCKFIVANV